MQTHGPTTASLDGRPPSSSVVVDFASGRNKNNPHDKSSMEPSLRSSLLFLELLANFRRRRRRRKRMYSPAQSVTLFKSSFHTINYFNLILVISLLCLPALVCAHSDEPAETKALYLNEAQPLVYMSLLDSGSGAGSPASTSRSNDEQNNIQNNFDPSSSPSLITAKCWNNYENDDECRHLNVITASNSAGPQQPARGHEEAPEDDSIITPVVIFESSSTIEPEPPNERNSYPNANGNNQLPPSYLAPPYFSSTFRPDAENVVLARHRTPPTANDVYAAPPAGATILPDLAHKSNAHNQRHRYKPSVTTFSYSGDESGVSTVETTVASSTSSSSSVRPATRPTNSIFVATPQPSKAPKTTTLGRTCRDENDEDCDEPSEANSDSQNGADNNDDADSDSDSDSSIPGDNRRPAVDNKYGVSSSTAPSDNFEGSGNGSPQMGDDNEDDNSTDDDDDGATNTLESSGDGLDLATPLPSGPTLSGPITVASESTRYIDISTTYSQRPYSDRETTVRPGAEIEVVVHPTLPPSFPGVTTGRNDYQSTDESASSATFSLPDDTYKSKPIFPPSSPSPPPVDAGTTTFTDLGQAPTTSGSSSDGDSELDNSIRATSLAAELDLDTFKPIPMPNIDNNHISSDTSNRSDSRDADGNRQLAERHKFDPSAAAMLPIKFGNSWMHSVKPQNSYSPAINQNIDQWPLMGSLGANNSQQAGPKPLLASNNRNPLRPVGGLSGPQGLSENSQRMQSEILSTMILYSALFILFITAFIIAIVSVAYWRRNKLRQQSLLQQKQQLINGASGNGQLVGSMSHAGGSAHQLMQQPSLLTTYSLGGTPGMAMGKVITSVAKPPPLGADIAEEEGEEEESRVLNMEANHSSEDQQSKDHGDGSLLDGDMNGGGHAGKDSRQPPVTNSSWSNEDQTTSSGSLRTTESQTKQTQQQAQFQQQQHSNSMSDRRQTSSSISDSQTSPEGSVVPGSHNQGPPYMPTNEPANYHQRGQPVNYQNANQPVAYNQAPMRMHPSRSVEDFQQVPPMDGGGHVQLGAGPLLLNYQQQAPMFKPPSNGFGPLPINGQGPYNNGAYPQPMNGSSQMLSRPPSSANGMMGPAAFGGDFANRFLVDSPISPARVALNPLATMGRRYQPGAGLNRNIYSEDSSSFMTTSPSLARTSSSSSFAFNTSSPNPVQTPLRGKPMMDPTRTGRAFNEFTPAGMINYDNPPSGRVQARPPPPIMGRKDRSEAWYV